MFLLKRNIIPHVKCDVMKRKKPIGIKPAIRELKALYDPIRSMIEARLREFERIWKKGSDEDIFAELVFCLLTPQSKARSCDSAVCLLLEKDLLLRGTERQIAKVLRNKTRFHNNKAGYIVAARKMFTVNGRIMIKERINVLGDPKEIRNWLEKNVKGLGLKEASHFLRNIGMGDELAILDRHILKNLVSLGVIPKVPDTLSKKKYLEIEKKMIEFSKEVKIPLAHLDLLLWYKEAGEVFK
jgi:N-glycosylase/DNA lyase